MSADDLERLRHMLAAAREAMAFIEGRAADDLIHNRLLLLALVKEIEIIGEAASRISTEGKNAAPVIPWGKVTEMRNRLTHGYFNWDLEVIWSTLVTAGPGGGAGPGNRGSRTAGRSDLEISLGSAC